MKLWYIIVVFLLLYSCGEQKHDGEKQNDDYLQRQLTPDGKHYIYKYSREGAFVTSNEISGRRLIGVKEPFRENAGVDVDGMIDHWSNDTLIIHVHRQNYEQPKDTFVIKTEYESYEGIIIKKIYEQPIVGGGYGDEIDFDSLKVKNNRIKFYGAKSKFEKKNLPLREINFPSGEVVVYVDSGHVAKIEIEKQHKSMDFSRIDASGKRLYHQPEVEIKTYEFIPRKKIDLSSIGEVGIFRDFKAINQR